MFPDLTEEERWRSTFALVPPTLCLGTAPDQAFFFIVTPEDGRARSTSRSATCSTRARSSTRCSSTCSRCPTPACRCSSARTRTPRPRSSGACAAAFAARGRYSWQEESHVQFNRWLVQRYRRSTGPIDDATPPTATIQRTAGQTHREGTMTADRRDSRRSPSWPRRVRQRQRTAAATPRPAAAADHRGRGRGGVDRGADHRGRPATTAAAGASADALATSTRTATARSCSASPHAGPARRRRLLPGARRRRHEVLRGQRLRGPDRRRQHPGRRRRHRSSSDLAHQNVDVIIVGAGEIADPLPAADPPSTPTSSGTATAAPASRTQPKL